MTTKVYILCIILVVVVVILSLFLILTGSPNIHRLINTYISNSHEGDKYVNRWNRLLFVPVCDIKLNYLVAYHYITKFPYSKNSYNIVLDGEPMDISSKKADIIISTKKELLPANIPNVYVPYFVYGFIEKGISPTHLIKKPDENVIKTKFCCFMYSNCDEKMGGVKARKNFLERINNRTGNRVDNLGRCYNSNYKNNGIWTNNDYIYRPYKFVIAFENNQISGYISEKITMPMISRAIPIYLGAPEAVEYFNPKSFVNVANFPNYDACIDYILEIDRDNNLYKSILNEPYLINNKIDKDLFSLYYGGKFYKDLKALMPVNIGKFIRPCQLYGNKIRLITFADGKKYSTHRIKHEAATSGFFKEIITLSPKDLDINFINSHGNFIEQNKKGYGYWLWKPYLIMKNLRDIDEGDYLIYSDSGNTINPYGYDRIGQLYAILEKHDLILSKMKYPEEAYIKKSTLLKVLNYINKNTPEIIEKVLVTDPNQRSAAFILMKKTPELMKLIKTWYNIACADNYSNIDDSESTLTNTKKFIEHRHDQSIISILSKLHPGSFTINDNFTDARGELTIDNFVKPFVVSRKK